MAAGDYVINDVQAVPGRMVTVEQQTGCTTIALNEDAIVEDILGLSSCPVGEMLQKTVNCGVRLAIYGRTIRIYRRTVHGLII